MIGMMMKWKKIDDWYMDSDCGGYRISKALVSGAPMYTAWRRGERSILLGNFMSAVEAKTRCVADYEAH